MWRLLRIHAHPTCEVSLLSSVASGPPLALLPGDREHVSSSPHLQAHGILLVFFIRDGLFMSDFYTVFAHTSGLSDF